MGTSCNQVGEGVQGAALLRALSWARLGATSETSLGQRVLVLTAGRGEPPGVWELARLGLEVDSVPLLASSLPSGRQGSERAGSGSGPGLLPV